MEKRNEFKLIVIDSEGFVAMGNNDRSLIEIIDEYNKLYRNINTRRCVDNMFGVELATDGKIVIINNGEEILKSTIYLPEEIDKTMDEYAGIAYDFLDGYEEVKVSDNIRRIDGVYHMETEVRVGENARDILPEYLTKKRGEREKRLELTF
jgi:hypothetical protein